MKKAFNVKALGIIACLCFVMLALPVSVSAQPKVTTSPKPTATVKPTPKPKSEIHLNDEYTKVYDGKEVTYSDILALLSNKSGNGVSKFSFKWYNKDGDKLSKAPENAGEYKLFIQVSKEDPKYTGSAITTYIIEQRPLEWDVTGLKADKPSDGTNTAPEVKGELKVNGIVEGDDVEFGYDKLTASDFPSAEAQRTELTVTVENAELKGRDKDNYTLPKKGPQIKASIIKAHIKEFTHESNNKKYRTVVEEAVYPLGDKGEYSTSDAVKKALKDIAVSALSDKKDVDYTFYTAYLQVYENGEWVDVTAENNPQDGMGVILPYPDNTNGNSHEFVVYRMRTQPDAAGTIEVWAHTEKVEGLEVTLSQNEPLIIAYTPKAGVSKALLLGIGCAVAAAAAAIVFFKLLKKDKEEINEGEEQ